MKKIFIPFFIFQIFIFNFQYLISQTSLEWTEISENVPASLPEGDFTDVHFIGDEGWITFNEQNGSNGIILYTDNAGISFSVQTLDEVPNVIEMVNPEIGFVGCASGNIYFTSNGGELWKIISGSMDANIFGISVLADPPVGYVCGEDGWIAKFDTNQLLTLQKPFGGWFNIIDLYDIDFPKDTTEGWVCGESTIGHYNIGTWDSLTAPYCYIYYGLSFLDGTRTGWCTGGQGTFMTPEIVHTTDGLSWVLQQQPLIDQWLYDVFFLNQDMGWSVGMYILATTDGGAGWVKEAESFGNIWNAVHAVDQSAVYVVGNHKRILKKELVISIDEISSSLLLDVFPNPCSDITHIRYSRDPLIIGEQVIVDLYRSSGRKIKRILSEEKMQGENEMEIDMTNLPSGVYYMRIQVGKNAISKKIVKL